MNLTYFSESEFTCNGEPCFDKMNKRFIYKLEKARSFTTQKYVITSSWRSEYHNEKVGGSPTSSHLKGIAVDISAKTSGEKYSIVKSLLLAGFKRIGVGSNFVHVDIDYQKAQEVIWTY